MRCAAQYASLTDHRVVLVCTGALISQLADADAAAVQAAWTALGDVTSVLPKDNLYLYVRTVRDAVASARDKVRAL
jgi:hypothetical protein